MLKHRISRWGIFVVMMAIALVSTSRAYAEETEEVTGARVLIEEAYKQKNTAASELDVEGVFRTRTEDYVSVSKDGKRQGVAELKPKMAKMFAVAESITGHTTIEKFSLDGDTATVATHEMGTVIIPISDTKKRSIIVEGRYSSTWVYRDGKWLHALDETLESNSTVEDNPVDG